MFSLRRSLSSPQASLVANRRKLKFWSKAAGIEGQRLLVGLLLLAVGLVPARSEAFPHVVQRGETLASIAKRYYGRIQLEKILSTANRLGGSRAPSLTPGMILDIPATTYALVEPGDTWKSLAQKYLGTEQRHIVLAELNQHKPWIQPELGQLISIPYNLRWLASGQESLATLAYRYLGSTKHAYRLVVYNDLEDGGPQRGDILLIPLSDLQLTEEGRAAAEFAAASLSAQGQGAHFESQRASAHATARLSEDVRTGRYISAVVRGTELLARGRLSQPGQAKVHRLLLEAYVALGARGQARTACEAYRAIKTNAVLDPLTTSPKILSLCPNPAPKGSTPESGAAAPASSH